MFDRVIWKLPGTKQAFAYACLLASLQAVLIIVCAISFGTTLYHLWCAQALGEQGFLLALFSCSFLALSVLRSLQDRYFFRFADTTCNALRTALLTTVFSEGYRLIATFGSAALTTLALDDLDAIHTYTRNLIPRMANALVITLASVITLFILDWVSGVITLLMLPVLGVFMSLLGSMSQTAATSQRGEYEQLSNSFSDALRGLDTLKRLGISKAWEKTVTSASERFRCATMKVLRVATLSGAVLDLISTLALAAVAVMLGFRLVDGSIGLNTAFIVLILVPDCFKPIRAFASDFHSSLDGKNALIAIFSLLTLSSPEAETPFQDINDTHTPSSAHITSSQAGDNIPAILSQSPLQPTETVSDAFPTITLHDVSFQYDQNMPPVLSQVRETFSKPAIVGIIGPSGAGKSTLTALLAGFLQPSAGSISVTKGGSTLSLEQWHKEVLYLPQNPRIFHATLRDNLCFYAPAVSDDALYTALNCVGLSEFLTTLPDGLNTILGEAGRQVSGGEAHRIALCRALLDTSRHILIFDEPTAHLDIETELALKEPMQKLMNGRLVFFGTHRLHWLDTFDSVLRIEHGRLRHITQEELDTRAPKGAQ